MGWVETAGYKLARVADYGAWYARFKAGLEALDHRRQASSSLPIVYQWQKPMSGPVSKCALAPPPDRMHPMPCMSRAPTRCCQQACLL